MKKYIPYLPYILFCLALFGTVGSMYASEILKLPPCVLCWYQRIFMYPLVAITAIGILKKDKNMPLYVLPLTLAGWLIALYHNLLYYNIIPEAVAPCVQGVSCTQKLLQLFGFMDIPLASFLTFTILNICTIILIKFNKLKLK